MKECTKIFDNCMAVFQGGGCKAIAFIGAYKAAVDNGVLFSEIAGTSAGSIIAALIAAGATPDDLRNFMSSINYDEYNKKWTIKPIINTIILIIIAPIIFIPWVFYRLFTDIKKLTLLRHPLLYLLCKNGMYPLDKIEKKLSDELKRLTGRTEEVTFKDLYPNLNVVASDIITGKEKVWNKYVKDADYSVAKAVCASCSYPFFFRPTEGKYVDGGLLSNSPNHIFALHPHYSKILSFQLESDDEELTSLNIKEYISHIIDTIVEGAVSLQSSMNNRFYSIIIKTHGISALDFGDLDDDKITDLINNGEQTAKEFFNQHENPEDIIESNPYNRTLDSYEQVYSWVATQSKAVIKHIQGDNGSQNTIDKIYNTLAIPQSVQKHAVPLGTNGLKPNTEDTNSTQKVYVSSNNTRWLWALLPTVIRWVTNKTKVVVFLPKDTSNLSSKEQARRRLLEALGCSVHPDGIDVCGFFIMSNSRWKGIVYNEKDKQNDSDNKEFINGCHYDLDLDSKAIEAWIDKINQKEEIEKKCQDLPIVLRKLSMDKIRSVFRVNSNMYKNVTMTLKSVKIDELFFLTPYVRLEKYRQIEYLAELYQQFGIKFFEPAEMDVLGNKKVLVSPIIVEKHNDKLYVIEGTTRIKYIAVHGEKEVNAVVVEGVTTELPVEEGYIFTNVQQLVITDNKKPDNQNCDERFRHIEEWLHPSDKFLKTNYY